VLVGLGQECEADGQGHWLASLNKDQDDGETIGRSLAELYVQGAKVDWHGFDRPFRRRRVALPTYPFQRERYWIEPRNGVHLTEPSKQDDASVDGALRRLAEQGLVSESALAALPELLTLLDLQRRAVSVEESSTQSATDGLLREQLARTPHEDHRAVLEDFLRVLIAEALGLQPSQIDRTTSWPSLGLNSIMALSLRNHVVKALGQTLPAIIFLTHSTIETLSAFLLGEWAKTQPAPAVLGDANELLGRLDQLAEQDLDELIRVLAEGQPPIVP
jgi:acyl transferase domain-containing protein